MDFRSTLGEALRQLRMERVRIQKQIVTVEKMLKSSSVANGGERRGRKSPMSVAERRLVSKRMKAYWADRRKRKSA